MEVSVGDGGETQLHHLHLSLLCEVSGYFRGCFGGGFTEAATRKTALPDVDPAAFALFVKWAYTGQLAPSTWDPSKPSEASSVELLQESLIDLYILGDRLLCLGLKNRTADLMQMTHTNCHVSLKCFIKLVHAGLPESKMAAYLVAQLTYDMTVDGQKKLYLEDTKWPEFLMADGNLTSKLLMSMLESGRAHAEYQAKRKRLVTRRITAPQTSPQQGVPPHQQSQNAQHVQRLNQAIQQQAAHRLQQMDQGRPRSTQAAEGCRWHEHDDGKNHGCKRWPEVGDAFAFAGLWK